jgi:hypothetical protein
LRKGIASTAGRNNIFGEGFFLVGRPWEMPFSEEETGN